MYKIIEHGMFLRYDSAENYFLAKSKVDKIAKTIKTELGGRKAMHAVALPYHNGSLMLSCHYSNGLVRFGIYDVTTKTLCRYADSKVINSINENTIKRFVDRLLSASQKTILLPPLNELWELSIQKENGFTDSNGLVELKDAAALNVSIEELQERGNVEKD